MAAIVIGDVSINTSGDIRWTGAATTNRHTVLEFIQFLMDKQDDGQAAGDDILDITVDTPFDRSTDQIVTLNSPFNIDDAFARHLYDGSVSQTDPVEGQETLYSGLNVIGPVFAGTEYMILQDGKLLEAFWETGINPEASPSLVFSRHLVKSKEAGADIDGKRIIVLARELGDQWRRFPVTLGTANSVAAIGNGADIFNTTSDATLAAISDITNTEGFQDIDIDGISNTEEYYSQWAIGANSVNDTYEYSKYLSQRSHLVDSNAETGDDFVVDNATIVGVGCEWDATAQGEMLTGCKVRLKIGGGNLEDFTGSIYCLLYLSDDASPAAPTGASLGRSESVPVSMITSSYEDFWFSFNHRDPSDGSNQRDTLSLTASEEYFIAIHHDEGTATEFLHAEGDTTSADDGNLAQDSGGWTGATGDQLNFEVYTSEIVHGIAGDRFEGINVDVGYDAETGTLPENLAVGTSIVFWGAECAYDGGTGTFLSGERVQVWTTSGKSVYVTGGKCLFGVTGATGTFYIAQDTASSLVNDYYIEGNVSGANCLVNAGIVNNAVNGGEGIVLAKDDNTGSGEVYLQIISGVEPVENAVIYDSDAPTTNNVTVSATIESRTLNAEWIGTSTGSNIIGTYGIGFNPNDVGSSDLFTDLGANSRTPPNNQTFTVSGVVAKEDRVLVGPRSGSLLDRAQLATDVTLSTATETVIQCSAAVPTETPTGGTVRVELDTGIYKRVRYESNSGNDYTILANDDFVDGDVDTTDGASGNSINIAGHAFVTSDLVQLTSTGTLPAGLSLATDYYIIRLDSANFQFAATLDDSIDGIDVDITAAVGGGTHTVEPQDHEDFSGVNLATSGNDVFISYIDVLARSTTEAYTAVFTSSRNLFVRVRDGGGTPIKTFESASAQFLGQAVTVAAVRTSDA
ncbi:hypothetical protein [uncultured Mediterranean phage]|nr:hypothetical protein [uncultured Mediterranean phage]